MKVLGDLTGADGKVLDPETHKDCPGHAAYVRPTFGPKDDYTAVYVCDARRGKHKTLRTTPAGEPMDAEAAAKAKAQRAEVTEQNKAWRSSETVRRQWLAEFAHRKTAPKDAATFIAAALVTESAALEKAAIGGHALATEWLGLDGALGGRDRLRDLIAKASPARAQHIALVVVLAAIEGRTDVHTWRRPGSEAGYLGALESWGYALSPVEQIARGEKPSTTTANPPVKKGPEKTTAAA